MNDYDRIAAVIRLLDRNHTSQPPLSNLAAEAGLSESHFHRLFRRWAGVTPKDFLQSLTAEHAKQRLRESATVLDAALDAGLSGPGRLHDLLVAIEAASPGEFKRGGAGMTIEWGVAVTPFGCSTIGWNARGICHLAFQDAALRDEPASLREAWPRATLRRNDGEAARRAKLIFDRSGGSGTTLKAYVRGTPFQLKVWRALLRIPEGSLTSYGSIARFIGRPGASRAVGTACGSNPVAYLIPCHRVIRETGVVRGYRWGDTRKRALLAHEALKR
jgi:AraC family transcriptional regulator of adaptative response/methylated-DNA-[protein]-cysteine methyltransferase